MSYEVMKCAFIFLQLHPVNNTSIIQNMLIIQQGELLFKSTQNGWINLWLKFLTVPRFKQRIDVGNQNQNFIGCKGCSKYSYIIAVQDPRSARSHDSLLKLDPGSPGSCRILSVQDPRSLESHGNVVVTGSKISKIPLENGNYKIQDPPRSRILDPGDPGSRIFLGSWYMIIIMLQDFHDAHVCVIP